jgi:Flp pilus assembly protein TadD
MSRQLMLLGLVVLLGSGCPGSGSLTQEDRARAIRENNLGTSHFGRQDWAQAEQAFDRGLEALPEDPTLLNNLSIALQQQGRTDEAETTLRQALTVEPTNPWVNYNLGLLEKNRGNFEAAIGHFETIAAQDDEDVFLLYNLGAALSRTDRLEDAERTLRRAVERNPTHVSSLYALGRLLLQSERPEEGANWIERSQELRAQSGLNEAVGTQYGEQGPYALGCDFPGGGLSAPPAIAIRFVDGPRLPDAPCVTLTRANEEDAAAEVLPCGEQDLAILAADLDNDGLVDPVSLRSDGNITRGATPLLSLAAPAPVLAAVDTDHDGDLDLFGCESTRCRIGINDGSGNYYWDEEHDLNLDSAAGEVVAIGFSDLDNDRDIDLWVAQTSGVQGFSNDRDGSFSVFPMHWVATTSILQATVADIDKDGWMDLLLATSRGTESHLNRRGSFTGTESTLLEAGPKGSALSVQIADLDNDGLLDLVARYDDDGSGWWRNLGLGSFQWNPLAASGDPLRIADYDRDGDVDLLVRDADGLLWLNNEGGNANHWIRIDPQGVGDNRLGIGTKIEILAGDLRQKFERTDVLPMLVGLGDRTMVDSVRMLWPAGVLQDEIDRPANQASAIAQLDRKGTSCPILYAWKDGDWRFVTDFLGGSAIGYLHAPGVYSDPDTDETVRVTSGLDPVDGFLKLRLNNQLEEVIWFDQAELIVVDHPTGTTVFPNERLMPAAPWPEFRLFASSDIRPLVLREEAFSNLPFKGYATPHTLELDLGVWPADTRVVLLLDGWIDYADSSSNLAASQAGITLTPPTLEVADGSGGWIATRGRMGFPAGLPKTMTVEVGDLFPTSDHRLRIATNMRIHWNRARVMVGGEQTELTVKRLAPQTATLRFGGFPRPLRDDSDSPYRYDPQTVDVRGGWKVHTGLYTAWGDVSDRLAVRDDRLVTTRSGDEIELSFPEPAPPAAGQTRSYFLYADGFGKDMDPNSAANNRVGPIPFHGMPTYPYGAGVIPPHAEEAVDGRYVPADQIMRKAIVR